MTPADVNRPAWKLQPLVVLALLLVVLWVGFGGLVAPFDLLTFLHAGHQVIHGHGPYLPVTSTTFMAGHAFVYPAFVAWMFAPLALIPTHAAVLVYTSLAAAAIVLATRWFGRSDPYAAALILTSSTTVIALQMGTVNPFLLLGLAAAWKWRSSHPLVAGVVLAVVAAVKLFLAPVLLWPLMRRRYSTAATAALTFSAFAATQTALGKMGMRPYLAMLSKLQDAEAAHSWSLTAFAESLGFGHPDAARVAAAVSAAFLAVLWFRRHRLADRQILALLVLVGLLMSPIVWSSYLLVAAAPLLLLSSDNRPLALAALASWVMVTPDQASPARVGVGVAVAFGLSCLALQTNELRLRLGRGRWIGPCLIAGAVGTALLVLPDAVRGPVPALAAVAVVASWALRQPVASADWAA